MRIRVVCLSGAAAWLLVATCAGSAAANDEVPAPLMAAAQCMARVVKTVAGVTDVQINVSPGQGASYPVLQYSFSDTSGRRRYTELSLFEIIGAADPYVFDRADIQEDVVAERVLPIWKARCHAGFGYITSVPR